MTELQGWIVISALGIIAAALYGISQQIEKSMQMAIRQRESIQHSIEEASEAGKDEWHRLHTALLASGVTRSAAEIKRVQESSDWAEFTAWADAKKRAGPD